jgi:threonine/homoserine/homoserine lactone efflux protein
MEPHFFAFLGLAVLVIVTPGPDTALTIRNSLLGGWPGGTATAVGVVTGQAIWALAAAAGMAELLLASTPIFVAVKILGAAYLVVLGIQAIRAALAPAKPSTHGGADCPHTPRLLGAFRQGVINDISNPKMAAFFTSLLPQFARAHGGTFVASLELGLSFCALTLVWLTTYAVIIARVGDVLRGGRVRRILEGLMGTVLIALGVRLAAEQR